MIPRRVRYECPKCGRRESHTEGCMQFPRFCKKCKLELEVKDVSLNPAPSPKELVDIVLNIFK